MDMGDAAANLNLKDAARLLMGLGFRVVPVDADKKPRVKGWNEPIPEEKVFKALRKAAGIAVVGGKINENEGVIILDIDDPDDGFKILEQAFGSDWPLKLCGEGSLCGFTGPRPKGKVKCECNTPGDDCKCRNVETGEEAPLSALRRGMYIAARVPASCLPASTVRGKAIEVMVNNYEVIFGRHPSGVFYEPVRFSDGKWVRVDILNVGAGVKLTCDEVKKLLDALRPKAEGPNANATAVGITTPPKPAKARLIRLGGATVIKIAGALIDGYKPGQRQDYSLAIAGWLGRLGVDSVSVALILKELHDKTNDEDPLKERLSTIVYTFAKLGLPIDFEGIKAVAGVEPPKLGDAYYKELEEKYEKEGVLKVTGSIKVKELLAKGGLSEEEAEKRIKEVRSVVKAEKRRLALGDALFSVADGIRHWLRSYIENRHVLPPQSLVALKIEEGVLRLIKLIRYITYSNIDVGGFRCWDGVYYRPCLPDIEKTIRLIYEAAGLAKYGYGYLGLKATVLELLKDGSITDITDVELRYIAFRNVVFDWVGGRVIPLSDVKPGEMLILHAIPHELNIQALEEALKAGELTEELAAKYTPKTLRAFKEWAGDNWRALYEVIGAALYPRPIKRVILLIDEEDRANIGDTGKSTYLMLIIRLVGRENYSTVPLQDLADDSKRFSKWPLFLKLVNLYSDLPIKAIDDPGLVKVMTGRDTILVERKFKDQFNYRPIAKFIFSANKPPSVDIDTADLAFWKRFLIIPFVGRFTKAVEDFELTLMDEAPSILALAIAAFMRVKDRGFLFTGDPPSLSELAVRNRDIWLSRFDTVFQFLRWALREGVLVRDENAKVPTTRSSEKEGKSLYEFYTQYAEARNLEPVPANRFTSRLRELGLPLSRPKGVYYLRGFKINEDAFEKAIEKIKSSGLPSWVTEALGSGNGVGEAGSAQGIWPEATAGAVAQGTGASPTRQEPEANDSGGKTNTASVGEGRQGTPPNTTCSIVDVGGSEGEMPYYGGVQLSLACTLLREFNKPGYDFLGMAGMLLNEYEHHHPVCDAEYLTKSGYLSIAAAELGVDVRDLAHRVIEALRGVGLCQ
jgi:phage/plasmid-associated DNA primase